jgi:hypothetical protein
LRGFPVTEISTIHFFFRTFGFWLRRVDSADTVQRYCSQNLRALVGVTLQQNKSFRSDHLSQPAHGAQSADMILARALGHY